jgi:hypothetical protein
VLLEDEEVEALQLQRPPERFAERVAAMAVQRRRRTTRLRYAVLAAALLALAMVIVLVRRGHVQGEVVAGQRLDIRIGSRATAVLEPGAHITWMDDDVTQSSGDVFYRVEPGSRFVVHTKAGDVTVEGTCFVVRVLDGKESNVKARDTSVGAALGALALVGVYEGKVALLHEGDTIHLTAGQSGRIDQTGVHPADTAVGTSGDDPLLAANANLADTIRDYKRRLEVVDDQKKSLEQRLAVAEHRLAVETDGASALPKAEYDLSQDDWKELARQGRVKVQLPCLTKWMTGSAGYNFDGTSPDDVKTLNAAHQRSNDRIWELLRPLCIQVTNNAALVDRLGPTTCLHVVLNSAPPEEFKNTLREVAEIRAGMRPVPAEPSNSQQKLLLGLTAETKAFENDLARSFGPDDAHRITYFDDKCMLTMAF